MQTNSLGSRGSRLIPHRPRSRGLYGRSVLDDCCPDGHRAEADVSKDQPVRRTLMVGAGECFFTTTLVPLAADPAPAGLRGRYMAAMGLC